MQYLFALIQIALIFAQIQLLRRRRQRRAIVVLVFTVLISIPSFVPTTSANNIRIDLALTDFVLTPVAALFTLAIWFMRRRRDRNPEA